MVMILYKDAIKDLKIDSIEWFDLHAVGLDDLIALNKLAHLFRTHLLPSLRT